jgi:hypothetical protein
MSEVDLSTIPPLLPASVKRVDEKTGKPTRFTLDFELLQNAWFKNQVVALDKKLTTVSSETADSFASYSQTITALTSDTAALVTNVETLTATVGANKAEAESQYIAFANEDTALGERIDDLGAEVGDSAATAHNELMAYVGPDGTVSHDLTELATTVGENTAALSVLSETVDGISVEFSVTGTIDSQTGGFMFGGIKLADGTVIFNTIFNSNVVINGNLILNGTVNTNQIAPGAIRREIFVPFADQVLGSGPGVQNELVLNGSTQSFVLTENTTVIMEVQFDHTSSYATVNINWYLAVNGGPSQLKKRIVGYDGQYDGGSSSFVVIGSGAEASGHFINGVQYAKQVLPPGEYVSTLRSDYNGKGAVGGAGSTLKAGSYMFLTIQRR